MSIGTRAAACASCGKRLNRKQWYYRNNQYFCTRRCWVTERGKAAAEGAAKDAPAPETKDAPAAKK